MEWLNQLAAALGMGQAQGAGYGVPGVGPGGMGANNGLSAAQQPLFRTPELSPEQLRAMQMQMGAELLQEPEEEEQTPPAPITQPEQTAPMSLDEILQSYGLPTEQEKPTPTFGSIGGWTGGW